MNLMSAQTKLKEAVTPTGATAAQQQASLTSANVAVTSAQNSLASAQQTQTIDATSQAAIVAAAQTKLTNDQANAAGLVDADNAQLAADQTQLGADESPGSSYQQKITTDINNQNSACGNNATLSYVGTPSFTGGSPLATLVGVGPGVTLQTLINDGALTTG